MLLCDGGKRLDQGQDALARDDARDAQEPLLAGRGRRDPVKEHIRDRILDQVKAGGCLVPALCQHVRADGDDLARRGQNAIFGPRIAEPAQPRRPGHSRPGLLHLAADDAVQSNDRGQARLQRGARVDARDVGMDDVGLQPARLVAERGYDRPLAGQPAAARPRHAEDGEPVACHPQRSRQAG